MEPLELDVDRTRIQLQIESYFSLLGVPSSSLILVKS